jgi:murein DD-endopeptidase MepM/ murein hydrolase activator NlpD
MKLVFPWLIVVILSITVYWYIEKSDRLVNENASYKEDLENSAAYTVKLQSIIDSLKSSQERKHEIPKSDHIKNILQKFFAEKPKKENIPTSEIQIDELREQVEDFRKKQAFFPDRFPINDDYEITQKFSKKHPAIDIAKNSGAEVVAIASGVVKAVYYDKYFGNVVLIDHLNGYASLYAHLSASFVKIKYFVEKGETIAMVGNSGNSSAPHLHLEMLLKGKNIDPLNIWNGIE